MTGTTGPAALTLHGYMDLPLDTGNVTTSVHYRASDHGQIPGASLALGENSDGPVRLRSEDPQYWREIEAGAAENARFLEGDQRGAAA